MTVSEGSVTVGGSQSDALCSGVTAVIDSSADSAVRSSAGKMLLVQWDPGVTTGKGTSTSNVVYEINSIFLSLSLRC